MELPTRRDYAKIPLILQGQWPRPIPPWVRLHASVSVAVNMSDLYHFFQEAHQAEWVVCDTEYADDFVYMIGLGFERKDGTVVGCQLWRPKCDKAVIATFFEELYHLIHSRPMVFQNADADVPVLPWSWSSSEGSS